jgi:hypothetical protein
LRNGHCLSYDQAYPHACDIEAQYGEANPDSDESTHFKADEISHPASYVKADEISDVASYFEADKISHPASYIKAYEACDGASSCIINLITIFDSILRDFTL